MPLELDFTGLANAIRLKVEVAEKNFPDVVNKAMKDVALRTIGFSPAVPSSVIAAQVRATINTRYVSKTGRTLKRPKHTYAANDAAVAIMVVRLRREGKLKGMTGSQIRDMALAMANARVRSGSYLKAGYLAAAEPFGAPGSTGDTHLYRAPGIGTLATSGSLIATIENDVPVAHWQDSAGGETAYEAAENALQSGIDFVERDILVYVERAFRAAGFE